jgi:hypothetical protein
MPEPGRFAGTGLASGAATWAELFPACGLVVAVELAETPDGCSARVASGLAGGGAGLAVATPPTLPATDPDVAVAFARAFSALRSASHFVHRIRVEVTSPVAEGVNFVPHFSHVAMRCHPGSDSAGGGFAERVGEGPPREAASRIV